MVDTIRDMNRADALDALNLTPEPSDGSWRYSWPTGQLVLAARRALRPRALTSLSTDLEAALAFVKLADAADTKECLRRQAKCDYNGSRDTRRV